MLPTIAIWRLTLPCFSRLAVEGCTRYAPVNGSASLLTFSISHSESLLASMACALLREFAPDARFEVTPLKQVDDFGGLRIDLIETARWLCLFRESAPHDGVASALAAGAASVLNLSSTTSDFRQALEALIRAETTFVPLNLLTWVAGQAVGSRQVRGGPASDDTLVRLTERERDVLRLVAEGCSNVEIAVALTISPNTVRTHLHALATKLGAPSRARILAKARALGISEAQGNELRPTISA
jgi:DNA-binding NarL/FixJ family response regulator